VAPSALPPLYAHRLGRAYGPDSSATALRRSLDGGPLAGVETDVCLTADDDLVCVHDPLLGIGTTLEGWAHEHSASTICNGRLRDTAGAPTSEPPLRLDDLLELVAGTELSVQVEVKAHADPALARRTAAVLCHRYRDEPARSRMEVLSFHADACAVAAAQGFRARLVAWADYTPEALAAWAVRHRVFGVALEHFLLSPALVRPLRLAGLSLTVGTVNRVELLERSLAFAPDAVCTDRPHELRAHWASRQVRAAPSAAA
jgi:glycerophosphoryl diester phosphodiesterase